MKKYFLFLLLLIAAFALMASCGGNKKATNNWLAEGLLQEAEGVVEHGAGVGSQSLPLLHLAAKPPPDGLHGLRRSGDVLFRQLLFYVIIYLSVYEASYSRQKSFEVKELHL